MKKIVSIIILFGILSCENNSTSDLIEISDYTLNLKWNKAYSDDSIDKSVIGLKWGLSYLGAKLPSNLNGIRTNKNIISIDINKLSFSQNAIDKLLLIHKKIIISQEYKSNNTIDLGRYITLLIGSSEHYYEIVEVPKKLSELMSQYNLLSDKGYVNNSSVSLENRIIQFSEQNNFNQLFLSEEVDPITGQIYEYETIELLPNGQLRFGIFDTNGDRTNNAATAHSNAGKPAKCMWCHESTINQMFKQQDDFAGYLTYQSFQNRLISYREANQKNKIALKEGVDFTQSQQHTLTELLYISFMEPSAERLSEEWNIPVEQVKDLLKDLPTHVYDEFPFLGTLYNRNDIENIASYKGLPVSSNVREQSEIEVNYIN